MVVLPVRWWFEFRPDKMGYENTTDFFIPLLGFWIVLGCRISI